MARSSCRRRRNPQRPRRRPVADPRNCRPGGIRPTLCTGCGLCTSGRHWIRTLVSALRSGRALRMYGTHIIDPARSHTGAGFIQSSSAWQRAGPSTPSIAASPFPRQPSGGPSAPYRALHAAIAAQRQRLMAHDTERLGHHSCRLCSERERTVPPRHIERRRTTEEIQMDDGRSKETRGTRTRNTNPRPEGSGGWRSRHFTKSPATFSLANA